MVNNQTSQVFITIQIQVQFISKYRNDFASVKIDKDNLYYTCHDNIIYTNDMKTLLYINYNVFGRGQNIKVSDSLKILNQSSPSYQIQISNYIWKEY